MNDWPIGRVAGAPEPTKIGIADLSCGRARVRTAVERISGLSARVLRRGNRRRFARAIWRKTIGRGSPRIHVFPSAHSGIGSAGPCVVASGRVRSNESTLFRRAVGGSVAVLDGKLFAGDDVQQLAGPKRRRLVLASHARWGGGRQGGARRALAWARDGGRAPVVISLQCDAGQVCGFARRATAAMPRGNAIEQAMATSPRGWCRRGCGG